MIPSAESCFSIIHSSVDRWKVAPLVNIDQVSNMVPDAAKTDLELTAIGLRAPLDDRFVDHALQLAILVVEVGRAGVLLATRVVTIIAAIVVHAIHLAVLVVEADRAGVLLATLVVTCVAARVCTFQAHGRAL